MRVRNRPSFIETNSQTNVKSNANHAKFCNKTKYILFLLDQFHAHCMQDY